jgi:replication-associated recombination protein RarA
MTPLTDKYRPAKLTDFVGLDAAKHIFEELRNNPWESAWILVGDSGTGKTTMALALAAEMAAEVHHIASRQCDLEIVGRTIEQCYYTPWNGGWHLVIVDEADQMTRAAQLCFLSKLDGTARPPKTIFIFTVNETKLLEKRFLSRCRMIRFEGIQYVDQAAEFLQSIWTTEAPGRQAPDFIHLFRDQDYNLRSCLNEVEMEILAPGSISRPALKPSNVVNIGSDRNAAALKAWVTIRARRAAEG